MEIMREETSRAVMNGLLIHDLSSEAATNTAQPSNKLPGGDNPVHLTMQVTTCCGLPHDSCRMTTALRDYLAAAMPLPSSCLPQRVCSDGARCI